jgi:predicted RNA binding protein YcfA (HicA-like mRNA interferase family)
MKVRELLRLLRQNGRYEVRSRGGHRRLKHPEKAGLVLSRSTVQTMFLLER